MWRKERKRMLNVLKNEDAVILIGDGRCDSPGHSSKYCTYTIMEANTGQVVDTVVIPVTDVANSNAMEKAGFIQSMMYLKDEGVKVDTVSTDRHIQIRKLMRTDPRFKDIKHQNDPWHVSKGISKKLNKVSKKKCNQGILEWIPSIINHFWWSVTTSEGDAELITEKLKSIVFHVINKHKWPGNKKFKKCAHEKIPHEEERKTNWMREDSEAHKALKSILWHRNLLNDIQYFTNVVNTTSVEIFNNLILKYLPKQYHFEFEHMQLGAYLAALDTNANVNRKQAVVHNSNDPTRIGKPRFKIAWRKPTKKRVARIVYEPKNYSYLKKGFMSVYKRAELGKKKKSAKKRIMAPEHRDSNEEIIERRLKYSRFQK